MNKRDFNVVEPASTDMLKLMNSQKIKDDTNNDMDEMDDIGWLVISGLSEKQVKAFGDFVIDRYTLPLEKEKIYYTVYGKPGIYNLITGEELKMI